MRWPNEAVTPHVAGRVRRQCDRRLRRRGRHADPDLPGLRAADHAGAKSDDRCCVHRGEHRAVLRPAEGVRREANSTEAAPFITSRV